MIMNDEHKIIDDGMVYKRASTGGWIAQHYWQSKSSMEWKKHKAKNNLNKRKWKRIRSEPGHNIDRTDDYFDRFL